MKTIRLTVILLISSFLVPGNIINAQTYKQEGTTYYQGRYYTTTGKPKVKRSESAKKVFLKSLGYNKEPQGYQIDHIKPLSEGGTDTPDNMQLITISEHQRKTAQERKAHSGYNSTSSSKHTNTSNASSTKNYYNTPSTTTKTQTPDYYSTPTYQSSEHTIYTGSHGGQYYINGNGNKTYVRRK